MKKLLMVLLAYTWIVPVMQAQIGKVGINTTTPAAMLHVKDSSVLFTGLSPLPASPGNPPASGAGTRMMWYPDKAAFRAGIVFGTQWNKDSIGLYSIALGYNPKAKGSISTALGAQPTASGLQSTAIGTNCIASGDFSTAIGGTTTASGVVSTAIGSFSVASGGWSTAIGSSTTASGELSTAMGQGSIASGYVSVAMGYYNTASAEKSTAMGSGTIASGAYSTAIGDGSKALGDIATSMGYYTKASGIASTTMGYNTTGKSYASLVLGQYNDTSSLSSTIWNVLDPVFIIGNGSSFTARSNAFTVLKSGKTGINTHDPQAMLHIIKNNTSGGPFHADATTIIESNQHSYIQFSQTNTTESGFLSGNNLTAIRSALLFSADSSMLFRTGGNTTRVKISKAGNVGLGTLLPEHTLHVVNNNSADGGWTEGIMVENINANTGEAAITLKNVAMPATKQWMVGLNQNPSLAFNYGASFAGATTRMMIDTLGNVGIGTITPAAVLDIDGTVKLGTNGIALTEIIKVTIAKDVASIAANTTLGVDFAVTNSATTSTVFVSPENDLPNGIVIAFARVSAAGNVKVGFRNTTVAAIDPASMNYYITVVR